MELKLGNKTYELATSLRVVYALKDITHAKGLQEAIGSIAHLDFDGQLDLLWAAYKAANKDTNVSKEQFVDEVLDNLGIFAVANAVNALADGLLYAGLSPEEAQLKKAEAEALAAKMTNAGTTSSEAVSE